MTKGTIRDSVVVSGDSEFVDVDGSVVCSGDDNVGSTSIVSETGDSLTVAVVFGDTRALNRYINK